MELVTTSESLVMRKQHLPLNQTQKVRLERAMERLSSLSSTEDLIVTESIPVNHEDALLNHWRVELNSTQDGLLNFPSMNMSDAVQKRGTSVDDELNMRNIFVEDDVLCAEVGSFQLDGSLKLLAPSPKYFRKLEKGQLLKVDPYLVKKSKPQFHYIESLEIDLILGCNGFIWVGEHVQVRDPMIVDDEMISSTTNNKTSKEQNHTPLETRQSICRIGNAIRVLSNLGFTMTLKMIMKTVNLSNTENIDILDMLGPEFHVVVAEKEAERRRA